MRRPRLELPGIPQHITHRGVNRGATFIDDEDFAAYLQALAEKRGQVHFSKNGVRFTYPVVSDDLAGRCAKNGVKNGAKKNEKKWGQVHLSRCGR